MLVTLVTGVPPGYATRDVELVYADAADPNFQSQFGIGPGCLVGPPDAPIAAAAPPVRERALAEAFALDPAGDRNLHSACEPDDTAATADLGARIRDQLAPCCLPNCAADTNPATPVTDAACEVFAEDLVAGTRTPLAPCAQGQTAWQVPAGETACFAALFDRDGSETPDPLADMSAACVDAGLNREFRIVRAGPTEPGTALSLACQLSADKMKD